MVHVLMAICLFTGMIDSETGCVLPDGQYGAGYSRVEAPALPGMGEWTVIGPWGGNLKAIVQSPVDDDIVLAGCGFSMTADAGGVFKSTDGGVNWSESQLFPIPVNDLCSAGPGAPTTFYAATRTGLYRSSDNGESWEIVSGMGTSYTIGIGVNTGNTDLLVAGLSSNSGVRRSDDGGATWTEVGLSSGFMKGFGCDPEHPDTMYLAMSGLDYSLYRSTDAGLSWEPIGPAGSGWGLLTAPFGTGETLIVTTSDGFYMTDNYGSSWDLVVSGSSYAPAVCDGTNLYAPVISAAGVYESSDQGENWTLNTQGIVASYWQAGCASSQGYLAGHYGGIYRTQSPGSEYAVSQDGISNGYFQAVSFFSADSTLLAGGEYHGLWRSTDLGQSWEVIVPGPANWTIYDIAPQSDLHYSGQVRYVATGSGVFRSDDGGDSWTSAGLSGTQVTSVAFDPDDPDMAWAGTASSGVHYTTDGGSTWTAGSGFPFALYPSIELIENSSGELRILVSFQQNGEGVYYSDDNGISYALAAVSGSYHPDLSTRWGPGLAPMAYLATDNGVYRSDDLGSSWTACPGSSGLMWAVQGSLDANVFAGTNGSGVRWSPDMGSSWQPLSEGIESRVVWDIAYGPVPTELFASLRGFSLAELTEDQLGIESGNGTGVLAVHPSVNPVASSVTFTLAGLDGNTADLAVFSASGRVVHRQTVSSGSASWAPGAEIPSGVYLVRLSAAGNAASTKLVLVR